MERTDIELLSAYHFGREENAFAELVDRHADWIRAAASRRLCSAHLADDATQAVFLVLAQKAEALIATRKGSLAAWLFHVMHFTCSRLRRQQSRWARLDRSDGTDRGQPDAESNVPSAALVLLLEDGIAQLADVDRERVVRRFYQHSSYARIGASCGITAEAARKRVRRSLELVRQWMLRHGEEVLPDSLLLDFEQPAARAKRSGRPTEANRQIQHQIKEKLAMTDTTPPQGGHQMISAEFLVQDVETSLAFFEKLGFPRRWVDTPDGTGRLPRASLTAGKMGKIWIRRADPGEIRPSPSINIFFWIDGGPDGLIAHRQRLADDGIPVTPIIDEHRLPNFNVTTPDGYVIAFFTAYVPPGTPPVPLVL